MSPTNVGTRGNLSDHLMSQSVVVVFFALYGMIPSKALKKGKKPLRGGGEKKSEGGGGLFFFVSVLFYYILYGLPGHVFFHLYCISDSQVMMRGKREYSVRGHRKLLLAWTLYNFILFLFFFYFFYTLCIFDCTT